MTKNEDKMREEGSSELRNVRQSASVPACDCLQEKPLWSLAERRGVLGAFVLALVATALITNFYPAVHMQHAVIQEAMLALVAGVIAWRAVGLGRLWRVARGDRETGSVVPVSVLLLVAAVAGGATSFLVSVPSMEYVFDPLPIRIALAGVLCLLTGVFEECLFRGLAFTAFTDAFASRGGRTAGSPLVAAAVLQAIVFAAMHVPLQEALMVGDAIVWAQVVVKMIQAFLFGVAMAAIAVRTQGLRLPIVLHAAFDCLYLGPGMVMSGVSNAQHFSGMPLDLALMVVSAVFLAAALRACWAWLRD